MFDLLLPTDSPWEDAVLQGVKADVCESLSNFDLWMTDYINIGGAAHPR